MRVKGLYMNVKLAGKVNIFSIVGFWTCASWVSRFFENSGCRRPGAVNWIPFGSNCILYIYNCTEV